MALPVRELGRTKHPKCPLARQRIEVRGTSSTLIRREELPSTTSVRKNSFASYRPASRVLIRKPITRWVPVFRCWPVTTWYDPATEIVSVGSTPATAHPHWGEIEQIPGRLAVTRIESERFSNGGIGVHIRVRNTGTQTLHTYRLYVSVIRDASLQPPS
jgi:hypothetical protein